MVSLLGVDGVEQRLAAAAGLPLQSLERLRVVRYPSGQSPPQQIQLSPQHPRGMFVWLGGVPDSGGHAEFSDLALRCKPRRRAALIWPLVQLLLQMGSGDDDDDGPPPLQKILSLEVSAPVEAEGST